MRSVPLQRHIKIKAEANPFDLEWERYFERRLFHKVKETLQGQGRGWQLWREQKGKCSVCQQILDLETDLDVHLSLIHI